MDLENILDEGLNDTLIQLKNFARFSPKEMKENEKILLNSDLLNTLEILDDKMNLFPQPGSTLKSADRILLMNFKDFIQGFHVVFKYRIDYAMSIYEDLVNMKEKAVNKGASYDQPVEPKIVKRLVKKTRLDDVIQITQISEDQDSLIILFQNMKIQDDKDSISFEEDEFFLLQEGEFERGHQILNSIVRGPEGDAFQYEIQPSPRIAQPSPRIAQPSPRMAQPSPRIRPPSVPMLFTSMADVGYEWPTEISLTVQRSVPIRKIETNIKRPSIVYSINNSHKLIQASVILLDADQINKYCDIDEDDCFDNNFKDDNAQVHPDYGAFLMGEIEKDETGSVSVEQLREFILGDASLQPSYVPVQTEELPTEERHIEERQQILDYLQDHLHVNVQEGHLSVPRRLSPIAVMQSPVELSRQEVDNKSPQRRALLDKIRSMMDKEPNKTINFAQLCPVRSSTRLEVSNTFSGLLSLLSEGLIHVHQEDNTPHKIFIKMRENVN